MNKSKWRDTAAYFLRPNLIKSGDTQEAKASKHHKGNQKSEIPGRETVLF